MKHPISGHKIHFTFLRPKMCAFHKNDGNYLSFDEIIFFSSLLVNYIFTLVLLFCVKLPDFWWNIQVTFQCLSIKRIITTPLKCKPKSILRKKINDS